jgi:NAD(P)-dependent dehydrogenase (short-subunit alcohol dehydrogenase family)
MTGLALLPLQRGGSRRSAEVLETSASRSATTSLVYRRIGGEEIDIHYAVTKSAQLTIAGGLAQLTKGGGVTVNTVPPGPTRSDWIGDFLKSVASDPDLTPEAMEAEFSRLHRSLSLIQRMIGPDEIAAMVAYLASPLAAATNGAALRVEGGIVPTIA